MPSIIRSTDIIVTKPLEVSYAPKTISPPELTIPRSVYVNGFPVVLVGDTYLPHSTAVDNHTTPTVLTNPLINVFANGIEVAAFGSTLLGCSITLTPELFSNVFAGGPNPAP